MSNNTMEDLEEEEIKIEEDKNEEEINNDSGNNDNSNGDDDTIPDIPSDNSYEDNTGDDDNNNDENTQDNQDESGILEDLDDEDIDPKPNEIDLNKAFNYPIAKTQYDSVVKTYDTSKDYSVLQYLEGAKWTVNYYNQNLGLHDSGSRLDDASAPALRPMTKIVNLMLTVTTPMSEAKFNSMSGSAVFYAGDLVPFVGDNFIVPLMNKKLGVFQVTKIELKSYVDIKIYDIDFDIYLFGDSQESVQFIDILEQSVNRTFYYNPDFLRNRSSVLFTEEETKRSDKAAQALEYIHSGWFREFRDFTTNLITTKKQVKKSIDVGLEKFFLSIVDMKNYHTNPNLSNTTYSPFGGRYDKPTIMDLLLNKEMLRLDDVCHRVVAICCLGALDADFRAGDLSIMGFDNIIFPYKESCTLAEISIFEEGCYSPLEFSLEGCGIKNIPMVPDIIDLSNKGFYLFSENFYRNERIELSTLEELLLDYIDERELNTEDLFKLIDGVNKWNLLEKFFYMPFLYFLILHYRSTAYSFIYKYK